MGKMVTLSYQGDFTKVQKEFEKFKNIFNIDVLNKYGKWGVDSLKEYTPKDTGKTSESWYYEVNYGKDISEVVWKNSNINKGVNIALVIQYGHGMPNGAYVEGVDYINPALQEFFREIEKDAKEEVNKLL